MSDIDAQIKRLREMLAQEKEILDCVSDTHNHEEVRGRVKQFETDLKKLEDWWAAQEVIRAKNETAYSNGAPCGGA